MSYVFGDSLTSQPGGMIGYLMSQGHFYKLHSQSMRFAATGNIVPSDILPVDTCKTAVYALGGNDAQLWDAPGYQDIFYSNFQADIGRLLNAEFNGNKFNVVLMLPPTITLPNWNTTGVRYVLQLWASIVINYFGSTQLRVFDLDDYDALDGSPDGVHIDEVIKAPEIGNALHQFIEDWEAE